MSFLQDLVNRQQKHNKVTPQVEAIPVSLPDAYDGLAGTVREPYRVNGPIGSNVSSPTQSRMQMLPPPANNYRG